MLLYVCIVLYVYDMSLLCADAVSYTHLDVYKRQVVGISLLLRGEKLLLLLLVFTLIS